MKKTILLASLVAVASMAAGTEGTVKGFYEGEHTIVNKDNHSFAVKKIGVETEVKVKDTGLSFGGTFQGKDIKIPLEKHTGDTFFNNSKIFVKYELPQMKGIDSYVKATLNPKVEREEKDEKLSFKAGNVELEGDISYNVKKDVKVGLNSKTTFPFKKTVKGLIKDENVNYKEDLLNYGANVESTHKVYVEAFKTTDENKRENEKYKDLKAHVAVTHTYAQSEKDQADKAKAKDVNKSFKSVELHAEGVVAPMKNLEIKPEVNFVAQVNGELNAKDRILGDADLLGGMGGFIGDVTLAKLYNSDYKIEYEKYSDNTNKESKKISEILSKVNDENTDKKEKEYLENVLMNHEKATKESVTKEFDFGKLPSGRYLTSASVNFKYTGLKDTEINVKPFINHINFEASKDLSHNLLYYGVKADVKNTGLVKNLTLTGKATLSGVSMLESYKVGSETKSSANHIGLFNFGVGAKYDYKVTDKFTVSPEANISTNIYTINALTKKGANNEKDEYTRITSADLTLAPKVSAEYKPMDKLTVKGSVEVPVNFGPKLVYVKKTVDKKEINTKEYKFGFTSASVKTSLNVEYKW